ncbi:MAG: translation elongation factor Tu [Cenarchaeum symbiont of Oopsacas minuta]|nr:translation elongation factor Tu [Cenarchaeum symbiont of Oopsacas minuta]
MNSINFVMLGDPAIAASFGKKGTSTDLTLYDKKESGTIRTWVTPNGFPEKIQPLMQAINLAEYVIVHVSTLDKFVGEQVLALDMLGKKDGILSHAYKVDEKRLESMIKGTVLEQYQRTNTDGLRMMISKFKPIERSSPVRVVIDHCFDVKGAGTVILGKVESGLIKQYDTLKLLPKGVDVLIKSIQMHDDPVEDAHSPARVGLSIKGASVDEISRGDLLCSGDPPQIATRVELDFVKNKFYKGEFTTGQMCLVSIGLQIRPAKFSSIDPVSLIFDRPIVYDKDDTCVILKPESETVRILGSGSIRILKSL